jgi:heptosyltransferase II
MVMTASLVQRINEPVAILAPPWSAAVAARMEGVARVHELHVPHGKLGLSARWQLGKALREYQYQQAIIIPRSLKAALVPFFAKIPVRRGFLGEWRKGLINVVVPVTADLDQTVKKILAVGGQDPREILPPKLSVDAANQQRWQQQLSLLTPEKTLALVPGAEYGPAKQWPIGYFAKLAAKATQAGWQVLALGSEKDRKLADKIPDAINLCGKTTVPDVIDILGLCSKVVCNDSGLMHVAAAVGAEIHAVYGSSSPDYTPPLTEKAVVHCLQLSCSPCFKRECPLGHTRCLVDILPERVIDGVL